MEEKQYNFEEVLGNQFALLEKLNKIIEEKLIAGLAVDNTQIDGIKLTQENIRITTQLLQVWSSDKSF